MTSLDESERHGDETEDLSIVENFCKDWRETTVSQFQMDNHESREGPDEVGVEAFSRPCGTVVILSLAKLGSPGVSRWQVT